MMPVFTPDPMRGRVKNFDQVLMSARAYLGHARIGTAATFLGCLRRLGHGRLSRLRRVLLVAKFARGLREIDG